MEETLFRVYDLFGYKLVGLEIPFFIIGFLIFLIFFVVRTTALLIAI
jgi:hypothetical protein